MPAQIIDGEEVARQIRAELQTEVAQMVAAGCRPGLGVLIVGDNPASLNYVKAKSRACDEAGIDCETIRMPATTSEQLLLGQIEDLNRDPRFHGLLVQQPLPRQIDTSLVMSAVVPEKDVDGLHPCNLGLLLQGAPRFVPCTAQGIQTLLTRTQHDPAGKRVVIVGRSALVGRPLAALLMQKGAGANATVTVCHSGTRDLAVITQQADVLVAAIGKARFVTAEMVGEGAVVVDVGVNRVDDSTTRSGYRLVGDVDFMNVSNKAAAITPVPGGVGPMTVAMLLVNTVKAAAASSNHSAEMLPL